MRTFWIYTLARLGLIVAAGLVLFPFLGLNLLMAVSAIVIGALLSYLLLGKMRARVAADIEERVAARAKKPKRKSADEAVEDELVEERISDTEEHISDTEEHSDTEERIDDGKRTSDSEEQK